MKIPLALSVQQSSNSTTPQSFQTQESGSSPGQDIWITVPEAAALLKVRPSAVVKRIQKGTLEGKRSEDNPFTHEGTENFLVLLSSLPERLQYQYHVSRISSVSNSDKFVSVDLVSPRSVFGDIWLEQFINIAQWHGRSITIQMVELSQIRPNVYVLPFQMVRNILELS